LKITQKIPNSIDLAYSIRVEGILDKRKMCARWSKKWKSSKRVKKIINLQSTYFYHFSSSKIWFILDFCWFFLKDPSLLGTLEESQIEEMNYFKLVYCETIKTLPNQKDFKPNETERKRRSLLSSSASFNSSSRNSLIRSNSRHS